MNEARFEPGDASRPVRILCHYCGFVSRSMIDAIRHDAGRPKSCDRWREIQKAAALRVSQDQVGEILRDMTLQDGSSLEVALDRYREQIEPVYR